MTVWKLSLKENLFIARKQRTSTNATIAHGNTTKAFLHMVAKKIQFCITDEETWEKKKQGGGFRGL